MSTMPTDQAAAARGPVVTLGPCGTGFMSVDPTAEEALSHLQSHRMTRPSEPTTGPSEPTTGPSEPTTGPSEPTTGPSERTTGPSERTTGQGQRTTGPTAGDHQSDAALPRVGDLTFFDGGARALRLDLDGTAARLVVVDDRDRSGELRARIDETFAHARERAYGDPTLLDGSAVRSPEMLRPPDDEALDDYLRVLCRRMSFQLQAGIADHVGSWWHNLFHRL